MDARTCAKAVGVLGFFVPDVFGLLPHEYKTVLDNLVHLALGALGVVVGFVAAGRPAGRTARWPVGCPARVPQANTWRRAASRATERTW